LDTLINGQPQLARSGQVDEARLDMLLGTELAERVRALGVAPDPRAARLPVLLGPGGEPWLDGTLALRAARDGAESTVRAYASTLLRYYEWCLVNGVAPREATIDDLLDFREFRLDEDDVSAGTWNGDVAALGVLYRALLARGIVDRLPWLTLRSLRRPEGAGSVRSVGRETYQQFRDVGVSGYEMDGSLDRSFSVATPLRNAAYCDLLVTTGIRRVEASYLTLFDLPPDPARDAFASGTLPGPICKGNKTRPWRLSRLWLNRLHGYHVSEWFDTVTTAQASLRRLRSAGRLRIVTDFDAERVQITGEGWRRVSGLSRAKRASLVMEHEVAERLGLDVVDGWIVPAALFPGTRIPAVSPDGWSSMFRIANLRVRELRRRAGLREWRRVTPHMLRHTFSLNYLQGRLAEMREPRRDHPDFATLQALMMHPLIDLKNLLGHSSMTTTLLYLREITRQDAAHDAKQHSWIESFLEQTA
jgi:integrase